MSRKNKVPSCPACKWRTSELIGGKRFRACCNHECGFICNANDWTRLSLGMQATALAYELAAHIENINSLPVIQWGCKGIYLINRLKKIDPERYAAEVERQVTKEAGHDS